MVSQLILTTQNHRSCSPWANFKATVQLNKAKTEWYIGLGKGYGNLRCLSFPKSYMCLVITDREVEE